VLRFTAAGGPSMTVHPSGKPISRQTHAGERAAATVAPDCTASASEFRSLCDGGAVAFCASLTVGVAQGDPSFTATASGIPAPFLVLAFRSAHDAGASPSLNIDAAGVGQEEKPFPPVRSAHVACAEHVPRRIEPERGQVTEHFREGVPIVSGKEPRDVLHEHESRSNVSNDPAILTPEARPLAAEPGALSCEADVLAGKTAADDVDSRESVDGADVVISNSVGPMLCENFTAPRVPFDLPQHPRARRRFDAKLQSPNAREQRTQRQHAAPGPSTRTQRQARPSTRATYHPPRRRQ
jgi:hypothetical protein